MCIRDRLESVKTKHVNEPEFVQTVEEVLSSLEPVIEKHPEYEKVDLLGQMCIRDRRQAVQRGGDQVGGQRAGTGHQQCFGIGAGQVFSADGPGRAGAEIGDGAGVQQRPGRAGVYIEQQRGAVQGGRCV